MEQDPEEPDRSSILSMPWDVPEQVFGYLIPGVNDIE
jgi:hypothetical protein